MRIGVGQIVDVKLRQRLQGARAARGRRQRVQPERHVGGHGQMREKGEVLEHHADAAQLWRDVGASAPACGQLARDVQMALLQDF